MQTQQDAASSSTSKPTRSRRGHVKSRNGCSECKRRHYKCDEKYPTCAHCRAGSRQCIYPQKHRLGLTSSSAAQNNSSASMTPSPLLQVGPLLPPVLTQVDDFNVNMLHMELLHHFTIETFMPNIGEAHLNSTQLVIEIGLESQYLMYEILAISAQRISYLRPHAKDKYSYHAMQLQNRAISLFNGDEANLDESTIEARLLFSSILGRHLLSDSLACRGDDLDLFLGTFIRYIRLYQASKFISINASELLKQSRLHSTLSWSRQLVGLKPAGRDCDDIFRLLASSELNKQAREVCQKTASFLQIGFDEEQGDASGERAIQVICWWAVFMPKEFVDLLEAKQPEALIILAYYAALLQKGEEIWFVGDVANYMLNAISRHLGDEWGSWLEAPRALLNNGSRQSVPNS